MHCIINSKDFDAFLSWILLIHLSNMYYFDSQRTSYFIVAFCNAFREESIWFICTGIQGCAFPTRYRKLLLCLLSCCDGCGASFSIEHTLDCCISGLVGRRLDEVQDAFGYLVSLVCNLVVKELVISDHSDDILSRLLLISVCVGFGSLRPRHCLILEWFTLIPVSHPYCCAVKCWGWEETEAFISLSESLCFLYTLCVCEWFACTPTDLTIELTEKD